MKDLKQIIWLIVTIVIFLFLWQVYLIFITLQENMIGIGNYPLTGDLSKRNNSIPRIIHQMWKTSNISTYPINTSHSQWKQLYPDYIIRLWTDEDLEKLMLRKEYFYLYKIYKSYPYSIQRADLARLVVLHFEGGIYADLDVFPWLRQVESLRLSNVSFIIPRSASGSSLINHFLVAQKCSNIIDYILHEIESISCFKRIYILPYLQVFSTGSIFLTRVLRNLINSSDSRKDLLWILSQDEVTNYVTHDIGRSWHSFDGYILNQIEEKQKTIVFIIITFIIFALLIFKHQNSFSKIIRFKLQQMFSLCNK